MQTYSRKKVSEKALDLLPAFVCFEAYPILSNFYQLNAFASKVKIHLRYPRVLVVEEETIQHTLDWTSFSNELLYKRYFYLICSCPVSFARYL